jgi:hypothetical protein
LATTHSRSAARLSRKAECEFSTRVFFLEKIDGGPHRGDRSDKIAEQVVSPDHAELCPVIGQSALAALDTLEENLADYWRHLRALALIMQAHGQTTVPALTPETPFRIA